MKYLSLFTGAGGIDLGLDAARTGIGPIAALAGRSASRLDDACAGGGQLIPTVVSSLGTSRGGGHGLNAEKAAGGQLVPVTATGHLAHTLKAAGHDGSEDGTGRGVPIIATAPDSCPYCAPDEGCADHIGQRPSSMANGVRRLTPRECERLMGWPDDHTRWTHDGREVADSRRYAMCGNGVVAPVAEWIGTRLHAELAQTTEAAA